MTRKLAVSACFAMACIAIPAAAQSLPNQVLALYPQATGELVYVDLQALRTSRHYGQLKAQVLPERFHQLEQWVRVLGIDLDREVRQLSWGFVPVAGGDVRFVGVAEGDFNLAEIQQGAGQYKLGVTRHQGSPVVSLGRNEHGLEFVFAFLDRSTAVYGAGDAVREILDRRAQGGSTLLHNTVLAGLVTQLNGRAPLWLALDKQFSALALKQMLPEASQVSGFDQAAARLQNSTIRFELRDGLRSQVALRCQDAADAMLFSTAAQAAVAIQAVRLRDSTPELARALTQMKLNRQDDRLEMELALPEPDLIALLQKNAFTLRF